MKTNNYIYIYEDNFINLLNLICLLIDYQIKPMNIKPYYYDASLFDEVIQLDIDYDEAITNKVIQKIGFMLFRYILEVYLSEVENRELIIYYFYLNSLKYGSKVIHMRQLKCVCKTLEISKKVSREAHRLKGFIRFKELENKVLYAQIAPTYFVLPFLLEHFKKRLKNEYFIIHDVKRNLFGIYDQKKDYLLKDTELKIDLKENVEEVKFEDLWKDFYRVIGIEMRKNSRCRMNFMPKKYWPYILEMRSEYEKSR